MRPSPALPVHGFLAGSDFASYHQPSGPARSTAYVLCPPLGYESIQSYHTLSALAQQLAASGIAALRLEYRGTGESVGSDLDEGRLEAWLDSIRLAVHRLSQMEGVAEVGVIGLRMGATLAVRAAASADIRKLALWEPCVSGAAYARELEILSSASLDALARSEAGSRVRPEGLEAAGYLLTPQTLETLGRLAITDCRPRACTDVLILERDDRPSKATIANHLSSLGCRVTVERVPGYREMMVPPAKSQVPAHAVARVVQWALEHSEQGADIAATPFLDPHASDGAATYTPVRVGSEGRLFGMFTSPVAPAEELRTPVLFLAGGVVPRTAVNRMYVSCARRLAQLGHPSLRLDVSGIGESPPADGARPNDAYTPSLLGDVREALDWLSEQGSGTVPTKICMVGLCSGAYAAFQTALQDSRVSGIVMINPLVFYWEEGLSLDAPGVRQYAAGPVRSSVLDPKTWARLLSGKMDVRNLGRVLRAKGRTWLNSQSTRLLNLGRREKKGLSADFSRLLRRQTHVALAYSQGDPGQSALMSQVGRRLGHLEAEGLQMRVFPGADHTFSSFVLREEVIDWSIQQIADPKAD